MKIYEVDFEPTNPVPYGLIISASDKREAFLIARATVLHTEVLYSDIKEITPKESGVLFYESGNY